MALENLATTDIYQETANFLGVSLNTAIFIIVLVAIWAIIWKGLALWKSAQKKQKIWFIALLIINTIGILEILYIYVFSKMKFGKKKEKRK